MAKLSAKKYDRVPPRGQKMRTGPNTIARRKLAQEVMRLREDGLTYQQIVDRLNVDASSTLTVNKARELVQQELDLQGKPTADAMRAEQAAQLDRLFNRAFTIAMKDGNRDRVPALGMALKAQERLANLMGLDAPKQTEIKDTTVYAPAPATVEDIVAQLAKEALADAAKEGGGDGPPAGGDERPGV